MRLKLDENLPDDARAAAVELGHDVDTVVDEGLAGAADPEVLTAAVRDDRFVITLDRGFGDVRQYPPGSHPGVLRVETQDSRTVTEAVTTFLANETLGDLTGCVVVVRGHSSRQRCSTARATSSSKGVDVSTAVNRLIRRSLAQRSPYLHRTAGLGLRVDVACISSAQDSLDGTG